MVQHDAVAGLGEVADGIGDRVLTEQLDGADGRIEAHNNAAERALRGVAIGRKNHLHLGSDAGGHSAAVIYALIGSAKLIGIDAQAYLRHVLDRVAEHPSNRIDELLPWAVAGELTRSAATSSQATGKLAA